MGDKKEKIWEADWMEHEYGTQHMRLNDAIQFAVEKHAGQCRKGTCRPYIMHPLETMNILNSMRADTELLMAGVLHDVLEDTDTNRAELELRFGADVASLVDLHTEDKSRSWKERKQSAVAHAKAAPTRVKMLILADKVSNLRSIYLDYQEIGDGIWERFHAPKEKQKWYYGEMLAALSDLQKKGGAVNACWNMMAQLYQELFG